MGCVRGVCGVVGVEVGKGVRGGVDIDRLSVDASPPAITRQTSVHFDEVATVAVISPTSTAIRKRSSIGFDGLSGLSSQSKKKKSGLGEMDVKPSPVS